MRVTTLLSAVPLSQGHGIPDLWLWIKAPGYIGFAAAVLWLTGGSLWALSLAQALLSAPITVTMYFLGLQTTDDTVVAQRTATITAVLVACNPMLLFFDNLFLSEQLYLLLSALFMLCLVSYGREVRNAGTRTWLWLIAADVWGSGGAHPPYYSGLHTPGSRLGAVHKQAPPSRRAGRHRGAGHSHAAIILPWSLRNLAHYGRFVLIDMWARTASLRTTRAFPAAR